jgi:HlyD family secretion protein
MAVRRSLILLTLFGAIVLPMMTFASISTQIQAENPPRNLQLATVQQGSVTVVITAIGEVEAAEIAGLSFTRTGRIIDLLVQEGDYVLAGDVLAQQENTVAILDYEDAQLALNAAELTLQDLLDDPDPRDVRVAEANVDRAWGVYSAISDRVTDDDLRAAELRYQQAQQVLVDAEAARRVAGGDANDIALLDAAIGEASFNLESARLQLEDLREGDPQDRNAAYAVVVQRQRELEQLLAGPEQWRIDEAQVRVQAAQMDLERAAANLNLLTVTAPFDGIISAVNVELGEIATTGTIALEITRIDPLELTVEVDEIDIRQIRAGMAAVIELDAIDDVIFPAQVSQIALVGREEEGIISYDVDLSLVNEDPRVRVGMTAEASIIIDSAEDVLVVPNEFIRLDRRANRAFVSVVEADEQVVEREIVLGLQGEDVSEVVSGLSEGDTLALDLQGDRFSFFGG